MKQGYFQRLAQQSQNRFWINNPTMEQARKAIENGAISCTTNPSYTSKLLQDEKEKPEITKIIDTSILKIEDDSKAAAAVQRQVVKRVMNKFKPLFNKNPGEEGFVSIQGDPYAESNSKNIIEEAVEDTKLGENVIIKVPVTAAGLQAIEYLIGKNIPIIATEVMGISQAICVCELYETVCRKTGRRPPFYVTHITGIFDEYLQNVVRDKHMTISQDILWQAGIILARKQYRVIKSRGYNVTMLGGGARELHHFTEMVGSKMHVTINWKDTADKLLELDPPVVYRMDTPIPNYAVEELIKIPEFQKAYAEDGLVIEEFEDFGPVQYFRDSFKRGWTVLCNYLKERRSKQGL